MYSSLEELGTESKGNLNTNNKMLRRALFATLDYDGASFHTEAGGEHSGPTSRPLAPPEHRSRPSFWLPSPSSDTFWSDVVEQSEADLGLRSKCVPTPDQGTAPSDSTGRARSPDRPPAVGATASPESAASWAAAREDWLLTGATDAMCGLPPAPGRQEAPSASRHRKVRAPPGGAARPSADGRPAGPGCGAGGEGRAAAPA